MELQISFYCWSSGEIIKNHFGDGGKWKIKISYLVEDKPLGTAGALYYLKDFVQDDFLMIFGDLMLDIDWNTFMKFHKNLGGYITLYGHPNVHPYDSDLIVDDKKNRVTAIDSKNNTSHYFYHNFVNAGLYCVDPTFLKYIIINKKIDLEKKLITKSFRKGESMFIMVQSMSRIWVLLIDTILCHLM